MSWGKRAEGKEGLRELLRRPARPLKVWEYVVYPVVIVAFAAAVFTLLGDPVNSRFRHLLFPNLPAWADLTDVFTNHEAYHASWPVVCRASGAILVSIVGPVMEKVYFRGYLLPRIPGSPFAVVASGVVLLPCTTSFLSGWFRCVSSCSFRWSICSGRHNASPLTSSGTACPTLLVTRSV